MNTKTKTPDVAPDAAAAATTSDEAQPTHNVRAIPAAGFWRGDHKWHADGEDINRADFSDEQWAAIQAEPLLVVTSL